jgi:hypothetical protein
MSAVAPVDWAARSVPSTAASGTSACTSHTSTPSSGSGAATASFAPGMTTIWFSPASSTRMSATPVAPSMRRTFAMSMPSASSAAVSSAPNSSSPQALVKRTMAPERAAATAWFAPLPPGA